MCKVKIIARHFSYACAIFAGSERVNEAVRAVGGRGWLTVGGVLYTTREVLAFDLFPAVWRLHHRLTDHCDVKPHSHKLCVQLKQEVSMLGLPQKNKLSQKYS